MFLPFWKKTPTGRTDRPVGLVIECTFPKDVKPRKVHPGDVERASERALESFRAVLEAKGYKIADIEGYYSYGYLLAEGHVTSS